MRDLFQDIRFAFRTLRKTPAFTALAVLTIGLGIGANTAAFSMVHGVLMRRLPYAGDDRLVRVKQPSATGPDSRFSVLEIADYRAQTKTFAAVAEYHSMPFQLYGKGEPQRVQTGVVSDNFFKLLGVEPLLGRTFLPGEEAVGAAPVVLLSYRYWMQKMGGDPNVVGSTFTMNDKIHTVVGVLPPLPTYPDDNDIWMPAGACPFRDGLMNVRRGRMLQQFALLAPGATPQHAANDVATVSARLHTEYAADYPAARKLTTQVVPLTDELTSQSRPLFLTLLAAAGFVLLIAMTNFANIMLARQLRRQREIALRAALGAGAGRLFRQLATESLCVSLTGGVIGVGIAYSSLGLLRSLATRVTPRASEITIDPVVLGFALVVSIVVGLAAAIMPLLRARRSLADALRAGSATVSTSRGDGRARSVLVGAQVAIAFVLLVGAGLMVKSLVRLEHVDGGYVSTNVLAARVDLDWTRYANPGVKTNQTPLILGFVDGLLSRVRPQTGVLSVAVASNVPLNAATPFQVPFQIRGQDVAPDRLPKADVTVVSGDYFKTIGIPMLRGHAFSDADRDSTQGSVVISQRLAAANWPGKDPVGQQISFDNGVHWVPVVGVVGDVHQNGLSTDVTDELYLPFFIQANTSNDLRVVVRTAANPAPLGAAIRSAVHELDPKQPVASIQTMDDLRSAKLSEPRVTAALLGSFAVLALVITAAGLAGVIAYGVSQRVNEIGIRVALGAEDSSVVWLVMRQGLALSAAGLVVGLGLALSVTKLMKGLLFETPSTDGATFAAVALLLLAVVAGACLLPARRALKIDPVQALRIR
ncbi:MAG TPA: ABC transporter permease [Gemmatimonadaceae bacterium]|jgi:predicted permease